MPATLGGPTIVPLAIALSLGPLRAAPPASPWALEILDARLTPEIVRHGPDGVRRLASPAGEEWLSLRVRITPPKPAAELAPATLTVLDRGRTLPLVGIAGTDPEAIGPTYVLLTDAAAAKALSFPPARVKGPSWGYLYLTAAKATTSTLTYTRVAEGRSRWSFRLDRAGVLTVDESPAEALLLFRTAAGARRVELRVGGRPAGAATPSLVPTRPEEPVEEACRAGEASECFRLADAYASGAGVPTETGRVVDLLTRGCDAGDGRSCTSLAHRFASGRGVARDEVRALASFQKACDRGQEEGCTSLAMRYLEGQGVAKNESYAMAILTRACSAGGALACNNLGFAYAQGGAEVRDLRQAAELYRRACAAGLALGCTNLSKLHAVGTALGDAPGAAEAQRKACELGDTWSCSSLGWRYFHGRGIARDHVLAYGTSLRACRAHDALACGIVGELYWMGSAVERSAVQAADYYGRACAGGILPSCTNLGLMHLRGLGIPRDEARGHALLAKACRGGYPPACQEMPVKP